MALLVPASPSKWNMFAGGTSAAPGKHGYDTRVGGQTFSIQPISSERGRHVSYRLTVFPGTIGGHEHIGGYSKLYRSPQQAVSAGRVWAAKNISGYGMALLANPRVRFKVGDSVSVPWFGKRMHARVVQIKGGGRMVVDDHASGLHDVPTEFAHKIKGRRNKNPGPSALPSKWTPATVTRKGGQIQIRIGGRR